MSWVSCILSNWEVPPSHSELMIWTWCVSISCRYSLRWSSNCPIFSLWRPSRLDPQVLPHDPGLLWPNCSPAYGLPAPGVNHFSKELQALEWQMTPRGCFLALWPLVWSSFLSLSFGHEIFFFKLKKAKFRLTEFYLISRLCLSFSSRWQTWFLVTLK